MTEVKGRVVLVGQQGQYAKVDDMVFPNPHSERMNDLEWRMRYAPESLERADQLYMASIISAYRDLVLSKTGSARQHVCSAIKWTGSVAAHKSVETIGEGSGKI